MKITALIAAILLANPGLAAAQDGTIVQGRHDPLVERVPYETSALRSDEGIKDLRKRVYRAAVHVCRSPRATMGPFDQQYCVGPTLEDALAQVDRAATQSRAGLASNSEYIAVRVR